jgi:hypothetical protein
MQQAFLGHNVEHGHPTLDLTKAGLTLTGTAAFATIPLTVAWQEAFSTEAVWKSDVHVTAARLDPAHLASFGLNLTDFVAGPLAATVAARLDCQGKNTVQATVNLQEAQLTLELRDLVMGQSRFKAVTITQRRERVDVTLGEGVLDAQPLMRALSSQEEAAAPSSASRPDIDPNDKPAALVVHLHAPALHHVSLGDNRYLQDVKATLTHGPEGWKTIDLAARIPEALVQRPRKARHTAEQPPQPRTVSIAYHAMAQGPYALSVRTNDLGTVLRVCDLLDGVTGGQVTIAEQTTAPRPDGPLQGTIEVKDFAIQRAPVLARLLAAASLTGLLKTLRSDGLAFTQLLSDSTLADEVVTLRQLRAHGGVLGLTAAGRIDIPASRMDVQGTIIPLYGINTVLGKVPIVGNLVLGGKGKGSSPSRPVSPAASQTRKSASILPPR